MATYPWLEKITTQFTYIDNGGAQKGDKKVEGELIHARAVNNMWFLKTPQVLRRCYFLAPYTKDVLWELFSWMNTDGSCSVAEKTISLNLNISERKVKSTIKELKDKGFIFKQRTNTRNVYKVRDLSKNPYVLLSEGIHEINADMFSSLKPSSYRQKLSHTINYDICKQKDIWTKAVLKFVKDKEIYIPFLAKLAEGYEDFANTYKDVMEELEKELDTMYRELWEASQ